jgi:hypothetical protein
MESFQESFNTLGCEMKMTIASTAMDLYRRRFLKTPIYKERFRVREYIFEAYYGGRTECFMRGKLKTYGDKRYYWYDYNSMYPSVMMNEYPKPSSGKFIHYHRKTGVQDGKLRLINEYPGVSDIKIFCPYMNYPLLPYRKDGKLIFPCGTFRGKYTHVEIKRALELGYEIKEIYSTLYYTQTFYPFKEYVSTLYTLRNKYRKENNTIMSDVCKLLLNSLYGKFATKDMQDIKFYDWKNNYYEIGELREVQPTSNTKGYRIIDKECKQNYILPILSCYVTAYARIKLHRAIIEHEALYCDTDSIMIDHKIKDDYELGGLKLEKVISKGILIRPKLYAVYDDLTHTWNIKTKGIKGSTIETIKEILSKKSIRQIKFMKIKEAMTQNYRPNQKKVIKKYQDIEDDKRMWVKGFNPDELQDSEPQTL